MHKFVSERGAGLFQGLRVGQRCRIGQLSLPPILPRLDDLSLENSILVYAIESHATADENRCTVMEFYVQCYLAIGCTTPWHMSFQMAVPAMTGLVSVLPMRRSEIQLRYV